MLVTIRDSITFHHHLLPKSINIPVYHLRKLRFVSRVKGTEWKDIIQKQWRTQEFCSGVGFNKFS